MEIKATEDSFKFGFKATMGAYAARFIISLIAFTMMAIILIGFALVKSL